MPNPDRLSKTDPNATFAIIKLAEHDAAAARLRDVG